MKSQKQSASPRYRVTYSGTLSDGRSLKDGIFLLPISAGVRNENQSGVRFAANLSELAKHAQSQGRIYIIIADSLYRHTLTKQKDETSESIKIKAEELGEKWLTENQAIIDKVKSENPDVIIEVVRWNKHISAPEHQQALTLIETEYEKKDSSLRKAIRNTARSFLSKKDDADIESEDVGKELEANINYLKEEAAVLIEWLQYGDNSFLVYHAKATPVISTTMKRFITPQHPSALTYLTTKIKELSKEQIDPDSYKKHGLFNGNDNKSASFSSASTSSSTPPSSSDEQSPDNSPLSSSPPKTDPLEAFTLSLIKAVEHAPEEERPLRESTVGRIAAATIISLREKKPAPSQKTLADQEAYSQRTRSSPKK